MCVRFYMKHGQKGYHQNRHSWLNEINGQYWIAALPKRPGKMAEIFLFVYKIVLESGKWIILTSGMRLNWLDSVLLKWLL